eukprot:SM000175S03283  [mRNA]  locus=s175:20960:28350:- [translate_table: standard]
MDDEDVDLESLDFAPIHNRVFAMEAKLHSRSRHLQGYTSATVAKWTCTLCIGLLTGLVSFAIEVFAEEVRDQKMRFALSRIHLGAPLIAFLGYAIYGLVVVGIISAAVLYLAPAAAGGGVTLVMANLNGIHIPYLLSIDTLVTKTFGVMFAVTTGLAVGPEGPLVHIGAAIANTFTSLSAQPLALPSSDQLLTTSSSSNIHSENSIDSSSNSSSPGGQDTGRLLGLPSEDLISEQALEAGDDHKGPLGRQDKAPSGDGVKSVQAVQRGFQDTAPRPSLAMYSLDINEEDEDTLQDNYFGRFGKWLQAARIPIVRHETRSFTMTWIDESSFQPELQQGSAPKPATCTSSDAVTSFQKNATCMAVPLWQKARCHVTVSYQALKHGPSNGDMSRGTESTWWCILQGVGSIWITRWRGSLFHGGSLIILVKKVQVMWRSLLCASVATVTLSLVRSRNWSLSQTGLLSFHSLRPKLAVSDMPFFMLTAAVVGILGALFNIVHGHLSKLRVPSTKRLLRVAESCVIVVISVTFIFALPALFGRCLPQPEEWRKDGDYGFQYLCVKPGNDVKQYNDLASLFFSVPDQSIRKLFKMESGKSPPFTRKSLTIFTCGYLVLFQMAYGAAMPGGLFMPSMMVGATFGGLIGVLLDELFPSWKIEPGHHALVGATAMLGGVFRGSISLVVIMVEGTGGIDFILPIIVAVVMSNYAAHHFTSAGAYEDDLERLGHVNFLHSEPPHAMANRTAEDIMSRNPIGFGKVVKVKEVLQVLKRTRHNGFPIYAGIDPSKPRENRNLIGLILRSQLLLLLEQHSFVSFYDTVRPVSLSRHHKSQPSLRVPVTRRQVLLERAMRVYHLFHNPYSRHLSSQPSSVDKLGLQWIEEGHDAGQDIGISHNGGEVESSNKQHDQLPGSQKYTNVDDTALDLRPYMNHAPLAVRKECSAHRAYVIFRNLGLRHLPVVDSEGRVVGIITRKDLAVAAKKAHGAPQMEPASLATFGSNIRDLGYGSFKDVLFSLP